MDFNLLTIFPEMFSGFLKSQILRRSIAAGLFQIHIHDLREFTNDKHRSVDDTPYGGGPGMIMKPEPLVHAIESVSAKKSGTIRRIYLSPKGKLWSQTEATRLLKYENLILLCGRYQGIDQRVIDGWIDEEISIGNYILSGGEIAAMVLMETMVRQIPGVLGNQASLKQETGSDADIEPPHYTRPREFRGRVVPEILFSGNHDAIASWRQQQRQQPTKPKSKRK